MSGGRLGYPYAECLRNGEIERYSLILFLHFRHIASFFEHSIAVCMKSFMLFDLVSVTVNLSIALYLGRYRCEPLLSNLYFSSCQIIISLFSSIANSYPGARFFIYVASYNISVTVGNVD